MANNISPSKVIYYISQKRKILVGRNNQVNQDLLKFDYRVTDKFNFQVVNSINQIIPPTSTKYELFGSYVDNKQQLHILFFAQNDPVTGNTIPFTVDTYTSEFMNYVKIEKEIDLTIVAVNPDNENDKSMVLRDRALVYPRPYIQGRVPTQILQRTILSFNNPVSGLFAAGSNFAYIDRVVDNFSLGEGLYTDTENQLVIGSYNEPSGTTNKAFVIGNGEDNSNRSNAFTVDYQGNVEAKSITINGQDVGDKVNQLENTIEAVSAAIPSVEGFATEQWVQDQGYLTAHQDLTAYATKDWVEGKGYITGVNLDPYATKDQLTAYATKSDLTVSASVLSNQISQLALDIPTKVSDLTNDAGYLTAVPSSYALKTDIPTGNAQLQNTAGYITGYNAGTGISISNGTISLTGEVGKTYYADNNTLQLNNSTNTFSIKSLSSKLNQGQNIILTPQSDGSVTINAIGGGGGGTGGATYLAGLGLSLSTVSAEDGIYKFYVNEPWLDNKINTATSGIQNLSAGTGLEIEDNVISLTAEIPSIDGLASEQWVETNFLSAIPSTYATKDYVDSSVSGKADLSSVYTKEEVYTYIETDAKINEATSGKADLSAVQAVDDKFANYYTSAQVDQAIAAAVEDIPSTVYTGEDGIKVENGVISLTATLSSITNDAGFITSADIPTSYVQQSELESVSGQLTNAIGAKANTTDVEAEFTATSAWANETFLTEHQSLSSYYTKSEVDSAIGTATNDMATQSWVEEQGYLTAHQSLDNYYNKTEVDTALALKADSADVYTKTEVNNISTNIVSQIPTDVATSAYVQAASGNAVSVATGWVQDKNYLSSINVIQQDTDFDENTSKLFFNTGFSLAQTEDMVRVDIDTNSIATQEFVTGQVSGKADQSTVEGLSTQLSTAIDTKANSADVYTKTEVYTKGETDTAINTATSGKVNKSDFDTVTGALSTAIDTKTTSGEVKTQIEAYGYQNATDVANAISGKADKSELQSVSGTLNTAIGGVSDRVGAIEADYTTSAQVSNIVTGYDYISAITVVNEYQQFEENTKKLTFDTGFGLTQTEDTVRIELDSNYVATVDALSSVSGTLTGQISAVDTKATNNTNSINALTGRVKAIEDDYTTSAYVTGQVNNLATGAVATNTTNITQLSTKLGTVSGKANANETAISTLSTRIGTAEGNITSLSTDLGTVSGDVDTLRNQVVTTDYLTAYVNNQFVAVSQLANDVGYITAGDFPAGTVYLAGEGLKLQNAVFSLTGTVLSGDGSTIAINNNVISVIGGGSGGKTYTGGTGIEVDNTNDTISLTADIPTAISDLTNDSSFATSAQVSAIVTGYNYLTGITIEDAYDQTSHVSSLVLTDDFSYYDQLYWNGLLVDNQAGQGNGDYRAKKLVFSNDFSIYFGDEVSEISINSDILSTYATKNELQTTSTSIVALIPTVPTNVGAFTNDVGYLTAVPTSYAQLSDIPTKTSDLTNDSSFATSAYVQSASGNTVDVATGWVQEQDYAKYDDIGSVVQGYGYQTAADVQNAIGSSSGAIVQAATGAITVPTKTSDLTNDSGYQTAAQVSAIASAYAQGGGGTTYTAGDGIDISNDEISIKLSGGNNVTLSTDATGLVTINATGGGGSTNLIAGNRIRLTETAQGTRIDVLDYKVSASNQTFDFDWRNGVETSALVYQYEGDYPIQATFNPVLPNGITFSNGIFTATSGATVTNGTSVISTTIFAEDAVEKTIETTFNTIGFVNAEISASTITSFVFDANNAETISAFTWDVVSGTPQNLTVEISGDLPDGVTSALSIQNRTLTFSATSQSLIQNGTKAVNVVFDGDNIERQVIALELTVQNVAVKIPLTIISKSDNNGFRLKANQGSPDAITLSYSKNNGEWTNYTLDTVIPLSNGDTIALSGANDHFTKDGSNWYRILTSGAFEVSGNIQSLMNFSDNVTSACFARLFWDSKITDASKLELPATTLADNCYEYMFNYCTSLTAAPILPATTLAPICYGAMFSNCTSLSTSPQIMATTFSNVNQAQEYQYMFNSCSKLNKITVHWTQAWVNGHSQSWVEGVAANGTFHCPSSLVVGAAAGRGGIPSGWTRVNDVQ